MEISFAIISGLLGVCVLAGIAWLYDTCKKEDK